MAAYLKFFNSMLSSGIMQVLGVAVLLHQYINQKEEINHQATEEFVSQAVWQESYFVLF